MTPLDDALIAGQQDPALVDHFYALFLGSTLYVPIYDRSDAEAPMQPIVIPDGELQYIPIFDSLDKLVSWAQEEIQYMQMTAQEFLPGLHSSVYLALNPGQELFKEFVPEEIAWLQTWRPEAQGLATAAAPPALPKLEAPKRIPHAMQSKLYDCFGQAPEVKKAYLAKRRDANKPAGWILVLEMKGAKASFEDLSSRINAALQGTLGSQVSLDILPKKGEALDVAVIEAVQPFYIRPSFH